MACYQRGDSVKCVYTDNNMTITEEGSTLLDDCPPVITITQTVYCGLHNALNKLPPNQQIKEYSIFSEMKYDINHQRSVILCMLVILLNNK